MQTDFLVKDVKDWPYDNQHVAGKKQAQTITV